MAFTDSIGVRSAAAPSPCPSWCEHDPKFQTDHESARAELGFPVAPGVNVPPHPIATTSLYSSDIFPEPRVSIDLLDEGGVMVGVCLPPSAALEFADRLIAFAWRVREQAALASRPPLSA